ncbi:MAG TPA: TonB-dependent receptor [Saprospiraceae bacterium]|nr:TonB-dependent receptor [Saprospiraceae bacterium]HMQ81953.1 TonB-dependent receptor [Saprospiraceae bacterium]
MYRFVCVFILAVGVFSPLIGQSVLDTLVQLPIVTVAEKSLRHHSTGGKTEHWDFAALEWRSFETLADLLQTETGIFIKSYGLGSLATTAFRGGSAGQTAVFWNGLPIQSPMLGQLDINLLPLTFADEAMLQYGGDGALWGSGAVGGIVHLNNKPKLNTPFTASLNVGLGSFAWNEQQVRVEMGKKKVGFSTRFFNQAAKNDFEYSIASAKKTQSNAALQQTGFLQQINWKPRPNQVFSLHAWWQKSRREIPPLTTQTRSEAVQKEDSFRALLDWKRIGVQQVLFARAGYVHEQIRYEDALINLQTDNRFQTLSGEVESQWAWNKRFQLQAGIQYNYTTAATDAYADTIHRQQMALFVSHRIQAGSWTFQVNARQELVDGQWIPFMPGIGLDGQLSSSLSIKAKASRSYRLPTLNDWYWRPGGNPNLLPERGWSEELGIHWLRHSSKQSWNSSITVFNRNIQDWILWSLKEGQPFWSANNITAVWSRGLETRIQWEQQQKKRHYLIKAGYDLIYSTNQVELDNPRMEKGEQLIYTPLHQAFMLLQIASHNWRFRYQHTYTGYVRTQTEPLPGYDLGDARLSFSHPLNQVEVRFFLNINNVWNSSYRVIERHPMPGRYFRLGCQLYFQSQE